MIIGIVICAIVIVICIVMVFVKLSSSKNNVKPQTMNCEENKPLYDEMIGILNNYEVLEFDKLKDLHDKIKNVSDDNDKNILNVLLNTLDQRTNPIGHGGNCDIMLNQGEELVYKHRSMSLFQIKTVSRMITSIGSKYSKNGLRSFVGNVSIYPNEQMVMVESLCTIYLTNKRIILKNPQGKTYEIRLNDIIDFAIENNSILISKNNGNPIKITTNDNFYFLKDDSGQIYDLVDSNYQIANNIRILKNNL